MPIYEYYCRPCHTIYSFFARTTSMKIAPVCPKCGAKKLDKQVSRFAISKGLSEPSRTESDPFDNIDEAQMEKLMAEMSATFGDDGEGGSENPQQMAQMMRKIFDTTGMQPTGAMLEAMRRMEAGEDPDKIDEEMGELLDAEEPTFGEPGSVKGRLRRFIEPPNVDPELYDL
jgi:putative FmdB family regulatory protein